MSVCCVARGIVAHKFCVSNGCSVVSGTDILSRSALARDVYDLIWGLPQFLQFFTAIQDTILLVGETLAALKSLEIEEGGFCPTQRINSYLTKVKAAGKGDGSTEVNVKVEEAKEAILQSFGAALYAGGGTKAVVLFRHMYQCADARKRTRIVKMIETWQWEITISYAKKLAETECAMTVERWFEDDPQYKGLKDGTIACGMLSPSNQAREPTKRKLDEAGELDSSRTPQSKDATDDTGDSEILRLSKRQRRDPLDSQLRDGAPSNNTMASRGLGVISPKDQIQLPLPSRFPSKGVPGPFGLENTGKPTASRLSIQNFFFVLHKHLDGWNWSTSQIGETRGVYLASGRGLTLVLWDDDSPMELARWKRGADATYEDLLSVSFKTEDLLTHMLSRLGSRTDLYILYVLGIPFITLPSAMKGMFILARNTFAILGRDIDEKISAETSKV